MFTPVETTLGALLLHQAATGFLFKNGNVLGASGLLREAMFGPSQRGVLLFVGMAISFGIATFALPELVPDYPAMRGWRTWSFTVLLGLMTGTGTKLSSGCTSGHMLCGLSRLSARSMIATMIFFPTGILAFHIVHGSETPQSVCSVVEPCYTAVYPPRSFILRLGSLASGTLVLYHSAPAMVLSKFQNRTLALKSSILLTGVVFGLGLLASGMADAGKVLAFFAFSTPENWDPSLLLVMIFGIVPSVAYNQIRGFEKVPELAPSFQLPPTSAKTVDGMYIVGAALFGIAWGISGVCPGPAVFRTLVQPLWGLLWMSGFWVGSVAIR